MGVVRTMQEQLSRTQLTARNLFFGDFGFLVKKNQKSWSQWKIGEDQKNKKMEKSEVLGSSSEH